MLSGSIFINYSVPHHQDTLYHINYCHPSSAVPIFVHFRPPHHTSYPIPVHQQPYIMYHPVTDRHHTLFQFIRHFPMSTPYYSSLYTPPSANQIRLQIVKRRSYYYQLDRHPLSANLLSVQLLSPPISRPYSSSSAALYHLLLEI